MAALASMSDSTVLPATGRQTELEQNAWSLLLLLAVEVAPCRVTNGVKSMRVPRHVCFACGLLMVKQALLLDVQVRKLGAMFVTYATPLPLILYDV